MRRSLQKDQFLKVIRAVFCLSFALLFLTETFIPNVQAQAHDPMELAEGAEEGEEKKEKEKEKEAFDFDEMFSALSSNESLLSGHLSSAYSHFNFIPGSVREIDTPPPELS
ncbi:MAG: hypothetical protein RIF46_11870 [Cyclobacteriaceae bacterium]